MVLALTIVASLPAIDSPLPALSLATSLGKVLYVTVLLVLAAAALVASHAERKAEDAKQDERDRVAGDRHRELLAELRARQKNNYALLFDGLARGLSEADPTIRALNKDIAATHSAIVSIGDIFQLTGSEDE
jgi:hypothetical protein